MKKNILLFFLIILLYFYPQIIFSDIDTDYNENIDVMIGQMLMIGFRGYYLSSDNSIVRDIGELNLGGVILFDYDSSLKEYNRNVKDPDQVKKLVCELQKYSKIPLFIAIDVEGGKVNRLKEEYGFKKTYSAKFLGELNDLNRTKEEGFKIGETLKELGINVNFAPVVDININKDNPAIGKKERSFSDDPEIVTNHAIAFISGLHENNIFSCIKHFPGHGSAYNDSHYGMTDVTKTWKNIELIPYERIIEQGACDFIMTAHIYNRKLDWFYPATLSKKIITKMLREKLKYNGVVISDDMQMKAISDHYSLKRSIYLTINAGVDIILFGNNLQYDPDITIKVIKIIKELLKEKKISEERIKESYVRISKLKTKMMGINK